jgi:recombination associated protein RdgC
MFFKAMTPYKLTATLQMSDIEEQLSNFLIRQPGALEMAAIGFAPARGLEMAPMVKDYAIVRLDKIEKIIPAVVLNKKTALRVKEMESITGDYLNKKAISEIKDQVLIEMMSVAFHKTTSTYAMLTPDYIIVNSPTSNTCEMLLAMLRKAIGSLPILPLAQNSLSSTLTNWATYNFGPPNKVVLTDYAKLIGGDGETLAIKGIDATDDPRVQSAIEDGYFVDGLGIEFDDSVASVITSEGVFKSVSFSDVLLESNDDIPKDEASARFDADLVIAGSEMVRIMKWVESEVINGNG